ncbi:MAG: SWIM zinc finger family protein [Clostridium sp.]|nr:SWIM zinc finger family protein [Clostridium sp.]
MSEFYRMLGQVDDDYLTGLSNKGIVKRAYKDMEAASIKLCEEAEQELTAEVDDVVCKLVVPLGESKCSCPSRSICRHIITAVLYVKRECGDKTKSAPEEVNTEELTDNIKNVEPEAPFSEILSYPLATIKKQAGGKALRNIHEHLSMEYKASISESSIVTVELLDEGVKVKLLVPVEYSTCSCGRKEFCTHRAEAILRYQIQKQKISMEQVAASIEDEAEQKLDKDSIVKLAGSIKQMLGEIISAGLARLSPELVTGCERFAIMCHNERLADLEKEFRALSEQLKLYFSRHASFRIEKLLVDVTRLYGEANHIAHSTDDKELYNLTKRMRSEYVPSKPLDLVGMGYWHFKSDTGYEGITIYFVEENTGKWYTYTNARPLFYEGKRAVKMTGKETAPWGLSCNLQELAQSRIHMSGCLVNQEGRLSSTSGAKAEIMGVRSFDCEGILKNSYHDFSTLFMEKFPANASEWQLRERLALIYPDRMTDASFDSVRQCFLMGLSDAAGKQIKIQIDYSSDESYNIKYLERIYQEISRKKKKPACFLGRLYISEGMLKMYPIEYYEENEGERQSFLQKIRKETHAAKKGQEDEAEERTQPHGIARVKECLENCRNLMTQIFQSGFTAVSARTIEDMKQLQVTTLQYGLNYGADMLGTIAGELERRKHEVTVQASETLEEEFVRLNLYINRALTKVKYDEAAVNYE